MKKGFMLIELLVVIGIIGILASILLVGLAPARERARRASCLATLHQWGMTMRIYADEHDGRLPWSGGGNNAECLLALRGNYITEARVFLCPSDEDYRQFEENLATLTSDLNGLSSVRSSYDYFGAYTELPLSLPPVDYPVPRVPVMWDFCAPRVSHHVVGGQVLLLDGSVEFRRKGEWAFENLPFRPGHIAFQEPPVPLPNES
ncbi:MAG TPA: prepilin-type N-terminal cleavage/methylation domain-containing protein [Candidatus Bathyarchaeia archaeon]|nr:prepilin-type N-terminal cleavage/methylation domain-containing protein [Candidatus Bathyarchaeia archaeon]